MNSEVGHKPSIAVLGPGAVGGFLAASFSRAGFPVTCVAKENTVALIQKDGIHIDSIKHGQWQAYPEVVAQLEKPVDILFVTTKATGLAEAIHRIQLNAVQSGIIVPLLNGIEHMAFLRERFGKRLVGASIRIEAKYIDPNHFVHSSPFVSIHWASDDIPAEQLQALSLILEASGVRFIPGASEKQVLFDKLIRLNALACTTAAFNQPIGEIRTNPDYQPYLQGCVEEGVAIANAEGLSYQAPDVLHFIQGLPEKLGTSLQRDLYAGKPIELDAIAGALIRRGQMHGLACPTIEELMARIRQLSTRTPQYS